MSTYCINGRPKLSLTQCFPMEKLSRKNIAFSPINVVYISETLLLDQHVSVAEWSKALAIHSRNQGGVGSIPSPTKNFFFESNFLFSPRVPCKPNHDSNQFGKSI